MTIKRRVSSKIDSLVLLVLISTLVSCSFGNISILGYTLKGYAWIVPLAYSGITFFKSKGKITFPLYLWTPWLLYVLTRLFFSEHENALQRTAMIICPIIVGAIVSKIRTSIEQIRKINKLLQNTTIVFVAMVFFKTGILLTGTLPEITGLAPEVITGSILAAYFGARYAYGDQKALMYWLSLAALPVIALTRTAVVATGISLPLTFAPLKVKKRIIVATVIVILGISVFYTERFQKKMFFSGEGRISDVSLANPDFRTTGRLTMWDVMTPRIAESPYFGYGANATEPFVSILTGGLTHPHNDWLRFLYDYGYVGTILFGLTLIAQLAHILRLAKKTNAELKSLFYTGATSFILLALFMITDNIILYAAFFGNLQFTILGLAYAAQRFSTEENSNNTKVIKRKMRW